MSHEFLSHAKLLKDISKNFEEQLSYSNSEQELEQLLLNLL